MCVGKGVHHTTRAQRSGLRSQGSWCRLGLLWLPRIPQQPAPPTFKAAADSTVLCAGRLATRHHHPRWLSCQPSRAHRRTGCWTCPEAAAGAADLVPERPISGDAPALAGGPEHRCLWAPSLGQLGGQTDTGSCCSLSRSLCPEAICGNLCAAGRTWDT